MLRPAPPLRIVPLGQPCYPSSLSIYWAPLGRVVEEKMWDVRKNITNAAIALLDHRIDELSRLEAEGRVTFIGSARSVYAGKL